MKKGKTLLLVLFASTLASCAVSGGKSAPSSEAGPKEDASIPSPNGVSIGEDLAKAQLSATLLNMKEISTFGVSMKGEGKAKQFFAYKEGSVPAYESSFSQDYAFENFALLAQIEELGSSSCAISASFSADLKYTVETGPSSAAPLAYDGPISGKAYYEEGMLYGDATSFIGALNPNMGPEQIAKSKVKTLYSLPSLDWSMVLQGMSYLEKFGFEASALAGEKGVYYLSYKVSCFDFLKASGSDIPSSGTYSGGIELWLCFDSSKIIGLGAVSDLKYYFTVLTSYSLEDTEACSTFTSSSHQAAEIDFDLKGTFSFEGVRAERAKDPDSYILYPSSASSRPSTTEKAA